MITTLLRISCTNLKRDRVAQSLTFLLPILFFSIFASVFGNQGGNSTARVRIVVVDEDGSELSRRIVEGLKAETALRVRMTEDADGKGRCSIAPRRSGWCRAAGRRSPLSCRRAWA